MAQPLANYFQGSLLSIVASDERQRKQRMDDAWAAYYGHTPDPLIIKPGQADDNVKVNKARVVVDKGVSFLFGGDITFQCDETAPAGAQQWLDACWKANRQGSLLHDLALNGGVCGHTFLKVDLPNPAEGEEFPQLSVQDPATYSVVWDPRNIKRVLSFTVQWNAVDPTSTKVMNYKQEIVKSGNGWTITDKESKPDSSTWAVTNTVRWPYPWAPVAQCKNLPAPNEWWGISDIEADVLGLNRAASFTLSNAQRIIRFHGHPKTVTSGVSGADINVDVDGVISLLSPDAKMWNLEMQSDLQSTINQYEKICEAIHEVARVPAISTGTLDKLGPLSGVALKVLYQPLIEKTDSKRTLYGEMLQDLCTNLLALGGYPKCPVTITWPEMLPVDPLQELQTLLLMDQLGIISKQTMADKVHLDWKTEQDNLADEAKEDAAAAPPAVPDVPGQPGENPAQTMPPAPILNAAPDRGMKPQGA
jgi:hypothetical protein